MCRPYFRAPGEVFLLVFILLHGAYRNRRYTMAVAVLYLAPNAYRSFVGAVVNLNGDPLNRHPE